MPEARTVSYRPLILLACFVAACSSSSTSAPKVKIADPDVEIEQQVGPAELGWPYGPVDLKYAVQVTNKWDQAMTVTRINVSTSNPAGAAYALRHDYYNLAATTIQPGETRTVEFWAHGFSYGHSGRENEPITFRGIVYFDTPAGAYQKVLLRELPQGY